MDHETYESTAHAKVRLRYHLILATKHRQKCLDPVKKQVLESFKYAESLSDFKILLMSLDSDHIHFLLKFKSALSVEQVVRRMKQLSTWYLWQNCSEHFKKFYWKSRKIWSGGYFCSTVGVVAEQNIKWYIENQGNSCS